MKILYTSHFERAYKKCPIEIIKLAQEKEIIFRNNPFHPALKTHKLEGRFTDFWSFSVDYNYRIIFEFKTSSIIVFHKIGTHKIYD